MEHCRPAGVETLVVNPIALPLNQPNHKLVGVSVLFEAVLVDSPVVELILDLVKAWPLLVVVSETLVDDAPHVLVALARVFLVLLKVALVVQILCVDDLVGAESVRIDV